MNALKRDASEVLSLVLSLKNSFAPINLIPAEVLSLIPDYCDEHDVEQDLITLTHVCRGWREMLISRSSLWTQLDFANVDKTRTYIQRSKSSPLEIHLGRDEDDTYLDDALFLATPHVPRLKSLTIYMDALPAAIRYFYRRAPLLEVLDISLTCPHPPVLNRTLFNGDLSSLRKLTLGGVITRLPWRNMANLTVFNLKSCHPGRDFITRLLNFFACAPLLHTIILEDSIPKSSNAPPERIVPLPHLRMLAIIAQPAHSILLNHLYIPTGASLILRFTFSGKKSPLPDYLPEASTNLRNLSHITTVNLRFAAMKKCIRLNGPSGGLRIFARWKDDIISPRTMDRRIFRSLDPSILSTAQRLAVSTYKPPKPAEVENCQVFQTLSSMDNLRTLILTKCHNLPFILSLNPEQNSSKLMLCPNLEEIVLYIKSQDQFHIKQLISMTRERASRDARLSSITIVGLGELVPGKEVFKLREHVTYVEYRVDDAPPDWDHLSDESSDESE